MTNEDKKRFIQIMLGMADNFRDSITKEGMAMRFDILKLYPLEKIEIAAKVIISTRKYTKMPPVAEFIEAIEGQEPTIDDRALIVANRILSHLKTYGSGSWPDLEDDHNAKWLMTHRWPYSQWGKQIVSSEEQWWVKQFCEAYVAEHRVENQGFGNDKFQQIAGGMLKAIE